MVSIAMQAAGSKEQHVGFLDPKRAFTDREASLYIGMSQSWLRHIRIEGTRLDHLAGPHFIKVGRSVRYLKEDLDSWLERFQRWDHLAQHDTDRPSES